MLLFFREGFNCLDSGFPDFPARRITWVIGGAFIFRIHAMPNHHEKNNFPGAPGMQMLQVQAHSYSLARLVFVYNHFPWFPNGMRA